MVTIAVAPTVPGRATNSVIVSTRSIDLVSSNNSAIAVTDIQLAPAILLQPQSQSVTNGVSVSVTFTASASGTAPLTYQWQFNGTDLTGATGPTLILNNVSPASGGGYRLRVTNSVGSVFSATATLTVLSAPVISDIPDQRTDEDTATALIPFTVGDLDSAAAIIMTLATMIALS